MRNAAAVLGLVVRRAMGHRRLLATVFLGVILAAALLSSVTLYSDAIRDLGLSHALGEEQDRDLDLRILSSSQSASPDLYRERRDRIDPLVERHTREYADAIVNYGRSDTFFLTAPGDFYDEDDSDRPRAHFQFMDDLGDRVELVDGDEPGSPGTTDDGIPYLPVWLGAEAAEQHGVSVGDTFDLHPFWVQEPQPVRVEVAGLVEPTDPESREWYNIRGRFAVHTTSWPTYPFWIPEETLTGPLPEYLGSLSASFETYVVVDRGSITSSNAEQIERDLRTLDQSLRQQLQRTSTETTLGSAIASYQERLFFTRLPLFALMLQIVGIVLYYLVMVSTMLVDRQQGEIALLRSRGASPGQVMGIYAIEGGLLAGAATIIGPLAAAGTISLLGLTPPFFDLSGGSTLDVRLTPWAFGLAALGALLAMAALLIPAYFSTRKSMLHYRQNLSRPPDRPAFLRYYLDLVVVAVAAYAFYQLQSRGSMVTERLFGDLTHDPIMLVAPTLFMLMVALVFLRVFPLVLGVASWAGRGLPGATIPLGLWHMVRSPGHYSRLILLLLLATAVGMFAAGFRATLEQSYDDRAAYEAGADARIEGMSNNEALPPDMFRKELQATTGVEQLSPATRIRGSHRHTQFQFTSFDLLGVMPGEFAVTANWRSDFASSSLEGLMSELETEHIPTMGSPIEDPDQFLGMWVRPEFDSDAGQLGVRLRDDEGTFWEYRLSAMDEPNEEGWAFYATDLEQPFPRRDGRTPDLSGPLYLNTFHLRLSGVPGSPEPVSVEVAEVQVSADEPGPDGFETANVIETFDDVSGFSEISGATADGDPGTLSRTQAPGLDAESGARIDGVYQQGGNPLFGLRAAGAYDVLPVVASETFLDETGASTGDQVSLFLNREYVTAEIVDTFDYFPTWDPNGGAPLLVANLDTLIETASRVPQMGDAVVANEAWIPSIGGGTLDAELLGDAGFNPGGIFVESDLRAEASADPLVAASWEGILFLCFAAVLFLTALGFVVYSYLTAQTRSLEFAILRTMGFSGKQIMGLVSFEQVFVIASGIIVGTLLGNPLGRLMIGYMGITETGEEILPPLVSSVSWGAVATVYSLLAIVFFATIVALVTLYSRLAVHRALRMGEL